MMMNYGIQGVLFDAGGTLLQKTNNEEQQFKDAMHEVVQRLKQEVSIADELGLADQLHQRFTTYKNWAAEVKQDVKPVELWTKHLLGEFDSATVEPLAEELSYIVEKFGHRHIVKGDAKHVLSLLKAAGLKTGVLSNALSRAPRELFDLAGVSKHLDIQHYSYQTGTRKPHIDSYANALKALELPANKVAFVGDIPSRDIQGPHDAGMGPTVLIRSPKTDKIKEPVSVAPDYSITELSELLPILKKHMLSQ